MGIFPQPRFEGTGKGSWTWSLGKEQVTQIDPHGARHLLPFNEFICYTESRYDPRRDSVARR